VRVGKTIISASDMRIGILCNDKLAIPAVAQLLASGLVCAVAMPEAARESGQVIEALCMQHKVSMQRIRKATLEEQLSNWLVQYKPDIVLVKTFPWKIPVNLLCIPRFGFVNFHYAPLPHWAGANPLF